MVESILYIGSRNDNERQKVKESKMVKEGRERRKGESRERRERREREGERRKGESREREREERAERGERRERREKRGREEGCTCKQNMAVRRRNETAIPPNPYNISVLRPANSMMNTFRKRLTLTHCTSYSIIHTCIIKQLHNNGQPKCTMS